MRLGLSWKITLFVGGKQDGLTFTKEGVDPGDPDTASFITRDKPKKMTDHTPLHPGCYYHIYNRANGKENLFRKEADYLRFLERYDKYILPVADTYAWVLMANHFHSLVRIRKGTYYKYSRKDFKPSNADRSAMADAVRFDDVKWETIVNPSASATGGPDGVKGRKKANPTNHFSHLFNAYAKYINERYNRHGSLFQRPFRRKQVEDEDYLRQVVIYIHNNPVHHGFVNHPLEYPWSSYHAYQSTNSTNIQREAVLDWFGGIQNFREVHRESLDRIPREVRLEHEFDDDT